MSSFWPDYVAFCRGIVNCNSVVCDTWIADCGDFRSTIANRSARIEVVGEGRSLFLSLNLG